MDDRRIRTTVGVITIATFAVAALLVAYTTRLELSFSSTQYPINIRANRAPGVGPNTPVRRDGVLIGRVERTESIRGGVLIVAQIQEDQRLLMSDAVRVRPSSLLGDAVVDIVQAGDFDAPQQVVEPGATIDGAALPDPIEALTSLQVEVGPSVQSLGEAGEAVAVLAERISAVIGEDANGERVATLFERADEALAAFDRSMAEVQQVARSLNSVVGDEELQQALRQGLAEAPGVVVDIRAFMQRAMETIGRLDRTIAAAEENLNNIEGLTKPLGERGPELAQLTINALDNLDSGLVEFRSFTQSLGKSQGTIGKLVNDPQLYNEVRTVVGNVNVVLLKLDRLTKQLEPILNDARVFTDKIAREPGRIVGGALNRGPGLK